MKTNEGILKIKRGVNASSVVYLKQMIILSY